MSRQQLNPPRVGGPVSANDQGSLFPVRVEDHESLEKLEVPPCHMRGLRALSGALYCVCLWSLNGSHVSVLRLLQGGSPKARTGLYVVWTHEASRRGSLSGPSSAERAALHLDCVPAAERAPG